MKATRSRPDADTLIMRNTATGKESFVFNNIEALSPEDQLAFWKLKAIEYNSEVDTLRASMQCDYAHYVEGLEKQITTLKKEFDHLKRGWISVDIATPEYNKRVLVSCDKDGSTFECVALLQSITRHAGEYSPADDRWYAYPGWGHELRPSKWMEIQPPEAA
ncbi:MAG: hypothetical protein V3V84_07710 [Candidatus Bathyarchaeia archaeon]